MDRGRAYKELVTATESLQLLGGTELHIAAAACGDTAVGRALRRAAVAQVEIQAADGAWKRKTGQ